MRISDWSSDVCSSDRSQDHILVHTKHAPRAPVEGEVQESITSHDEVADGLHEYRPASTRLNQHMRFRTDTIKRLFCRREVGAQLRRDILMDAHAGEVLVRREQRYEKPCSEVVNTSRTEALVRLLKGSVGEIGRASCRERVCQYG